MNNIFADLHLHTKYSDGKLSPYELTSLLVENGIKKCAITDHDSIGAADSGEIAGGIDCIYGVEFSCRFREISVHVLGYVKSLEYVRPFLKERNEDRLRRAGEMVKKLNDVSVNITLEDVLAEAGNADAVGRPHIARQIIKQGYAQCIEEVFYKYIGDGAPCYVPKFAFKISDTLDIIHESRGLAVVAHPIENNVISVLDELLEYEFDGIEVFTPKNDMKWIEKLCMRAERGRYLITGGSDYHGDKPYVPYGLNEENYGKFLERWGKL